MSKRTLPILEFKARDGVDFEISQAALQRWNPGFKAQSSDTQAEATISIYGAIGENWDGTGITAGRISGALRAIGDKDVIVNINSPGGSAFEGIAIYNLLRAHQKNVTVRVIGMAASAASIIAMAGDTIQIGRAAFIMIHNVLLVAVGNRNDLRGVADVMEPIDRALADLYAARTGQKADDVAALMDKETWFGGSDAIDQGFADELLPADQVQEETQAKRPSAQARIELQAALAKAGYSRGQQRELLKEFSGMPGAAANATPSAGGHGTQITPGADPVEPVASTPQSKTKGTDMTLEELKAQHPELYNAIRAEGRTEGITAECARIRDVEAQALPGHVDLINKLKFDGKTTGPEAASQVLAAERLKLGKKTEDILADATPLAGATPSPSASGTQPKHEQADDSTKTVEERCKAAWETDAKVRSEFLSLADFTAYTKAREAGGVRVLSSNKAAA
jgi:ATP-dependent Clp protease protease subunit